MNWERVLLAMPPAITAAVVGIGLRMGASEEARAALVYGTPPAEARAGLAWTVTVWREAGGVREPIAEEPIFVDATMPDSRAAHRDATTNRDGIAEVWLPLEGVAPGMAIAMSVTSKRDGTLLARGTATVPPAYPKDAAREPAFLTPSQREGTIRLDVFVVGRALAPEFPSRVLVRANGAVDVTVEPEPGLEVAATKLSTCANGWAAFSMVARAHVVGATFRAEERSQTAARSGTWFGALPVAGGALFVDIPADPRAEDTKLRVRSPTPRPAAYVEIDDPEGRALAEIVDLQPDAAGMRSGTIDFPRHAPREGFVVTSGEANGAAMISGATLAFPFIASPMAPCDLWPRLAQMTTRGFPRTPLLDGFGPVRAAGAKARGRGLTLALSTVALAAIVETLLLLRHASRGRAALSAMPPHVVEGRAGTVAVGLGIALLGFALLAALLLRSAS